MRWLMLMVGTVAEFFITLFNRTAGLMAELPGRAFALATEQPVSVGAALAAVPAVIYLILRRTRRA